MMGQQLVPRQRTELINLEEFVSQDHLLRAIDRYRDLTEFREHLKNSNSHIGRPSVEPELILRVPIIGYCYGIRSERRLCEEVHLNLAYRWFCHPGIQGRVPDHSMFSKNRQGRCPTPACGTRCPRDYWGDPDQWTRPVREQLIALDASNLPADPPADFAD